VNVSVGTSFLTSAMFWIVFGEDGVVPVPPTVTSWPPNTLVCTIAEVWQ